MWRNWNPQILLRGPKNGTAILENNMAVPQKVTQLSYDPEIPPKKNENKCPHKIIY